MTTGVVLIFIITLLISPSFQWSHDRQILKSTGSNPNTDQAVSAMITDGINIYYGVAAMLFRTNMDGTGPISVQLGGSGMITAIYKSTTTGELFVARGDTFWKVPADLNDGGTSVGSVGDNIIDFVAIQATSSSAITFFFSVSSSTRITLHGTNTGTSSGKLKRIIWNGSNMASSVQLFPSGTSYGVSFVDSYHDIVGNRIFFAGGGGKLVEISIASGTVTPRDLKLTSPITALTGSYDTDAGQLNLFPAFKLGTSGLFSKVVVDGTDYNLNGIIFVPQVVDTVTILGSKTVFLASRYTSGNNPRIYRVDVSTFTPFEIGGKQFYEVNTNDPEDTHWGSSLVTESENSVLFGRWYSSGVNGDFRTEVFNIADCSGGCTECKASDPLYCGSCRADVSDASKWGATCTPESTCGQVWEEDPSQSCGNINSITPIIGSTDGSTSIVIEGNIDFPTNALCSFDSSEYTPESIVANTITCANPAEQTGVVGFPVEVTVDIPLSGATVDGVEFNFYDCKALSCSTCLTRPDCGWCYFAGSCMGEEECSAQEITDWLQTTDCPRVTSTTGEFVEQGGETISITVSGDLVDISEATGHTYVCSIDGIHYNASRIDSSTLSCDVGTYAADLDIEYTIEVGIATSPGLALQNPYTIGSSETVTFYDCSAVSICGICSSLERCFFCNGTCILDNPGQCTEQCPEILSATPPNDEISGGTTITLTVENLYAGVGDYFCVFEDIDDELAIPSETTATYIDNTTLTCLTPTVTGRNYILSIKDTSEPLTSPLSYTFYDCTEELTCAGCFEYGRCTFSTESSEFVITGSCALTGDGNLPITVEQCPVINATSGAAYNILGGGTISVDIAPAAFDDNIDVFCNFGNVFVPITSFDENGHALCEIPAYDSAKVVQFYISKENGSVPLTDAIDFEFYDCEDHSDGCNECIIEHEFCKWCKGSCINPSPTADDGCTAGLTSVCPTLLTIETPIPVVTSSQTTSLLLNISTFENDIIADYTCKLASSSSEFTQDVENLAGGLYCIITDDVPQGTYAVTLRYLTKQYAYGEADLRIYQCDESDCSDSCFAEPECAWCIINGTCTPRIYCDSQYQNDQCANVAFEPDFTGITGSDSISISVTGMNITSIQNDILCNFGGVIVTPISSANSVVTCRSPALSANPNLEVRLEYNGLAFSDESATIEYLDCSSYSSCSSCSAKENCGWCLHDNSCTMEKECVAPKNWVESECPTLLNVYPSSITVQSTENITVVGTNFIDYELQIQLTPNEGFNNITYINETAFSFSLIDSWTTIGQTKILLFLNEKIFAINDLDFEVEAKDSTNTDSEPQYWWILIIVALVVVVVVAGIIFFVIWKQKGDSLDLVEPDYEALAFGEDMERIMWEMPPDNYSLFEEYLIREKKKVIFTSFVSIIGSADLDRAAKSFVYLLEAEGYTLDFFIYVIGLEIETSTTPNTIFRGNSLASKMFKTYCRMTAVPYLFDTIAQFIQPLEQLQQRQQNTKGGKENQVEMDLLDVNVEVDTNKGGEGEDLEANSYQLQHLCNRILNAILKSTETMPAEFRRIFAFVKEQIYEKFADEDEDTIYYAVGGLIFLRFVVPSITAPHVYGLLPNPPSVETQRQLILIGKVIQSIGNMVQPGKKEKFMLLLSDYIETSIPKVKDFYELISVEGGNQTRRAVAVSDIVRCNALAQLYTIFSGKDGMLKDAIVTLSEEQDFDPLPYLRKVENIVETYGVEPPSKVKARKKKR